MRYLILIYGNPQSRAVWDSFPTDRKLAGLAVHASLVESLTQSGELVSSAALAEPSDGRRVVVDDDGAVSSDGPYAEVKEHLAGYYLVEVDDVDQAMAIAGRIPEAEYGVVEVRPVRNLSDFPVD